MQVHNKRKLSDTIEHTKRHKIDREKDTQIVVQGLKQQQQEIVQAPVKDVVPSYQDRFGRIGKVVAEALHTFSLDVCGVVCTYAVCGLVKSSIAPHVLPSFEHIVKPTADITHFDIACDHKTGNVWLLAGDTIFQYSTDGQMICPYNLPMPCRNLAIRNNTAFLSAKDYTGTEGVMVAKLDQCEIHHVEQTLRARFYGVCVCDDGYFAACDVTNDQIVVQKSDGSLDRTFGKYGSREGELHTPIAIGHSSKKDWIVADYMNHRIQVFDSHGRFLRMFGSSDVKCQWPVSLAVDRQDHVYVIQQYRELSVFQSRNGTFITSIKLSSPGQAVCLDNEGRILVVTQDGQIHVFGFEA